MYMYRYNTIQKITPLPALLAPDDEGLALGPGEGFPIPGPGAVPLPDKENAAARGIIHV